MSKVLLVTIAVVVACFVFAPQVFAQDSSAGVAVTIVLDGGPEDGVIVCGAEGSINKLCDREYDPNILGVVTKNPAVSFSAINPVGNTETIVSAGKAYVLVNTANGPIKVGDYITSSKTKGIGQKALKSGYIVGSALEEYNNPDKTKVGKILVALAVKPAVLKQNAEANLLQMIKDGVEGAFESPLSALRYFVAALITCVTFIFGFIHFGRIAKSGVEAIGRNPLAGKMIQAGVIMNMAITIVIMAASIFVSYLVLVI